MHGEVHGKAKECSLEETMVELVSPKCWIRVTYPNVEGTGINAGVDAFKSCIWGDGSFL